MMEEGASYLSTLKQHSEFYPNIPRPSSPFSGFMGGYGLRPQYFLNDKSQSFGFYHPKKNHLKTKELANHEKIIAAYVEFMLKVGEKLHFGVMKENKDLFLKEKAPSIVPSKNLPTSSIFITKGFTNSIHRDKDKTKYVLGLWLGDEFDKKVPRIVGHFVYLR